MEKSTQKNAYIAFGNCFECLYPFMLFMSLFCGGIAHVHCVTDIAHVNHAASMLMDDGCASKGTTLTFSYEQDCFFVRKHGFCRVPFAVDIHIFRFTVVCSNLYKVLPLAPG